MTCKQVINKSVHNVKKGRKERENERLGDIKADIVNELE
jgi:hypothetical protein